MNLNPGNRKHLLEKYLDGTLSPADARSLKALLDKDLVFQQEYQIMQLAIEAIKYAGLKEQVSAMHREIIKPLAVENRSSKPKVISIVYQSLRIAGVVLLLVGAFGIYKYATVNAESVYREYYQSYEPARVRSTSINRLEEAFSKKQWETVIALSAAVTKDNKSVFLSGVALLETGKNAAAIENFKTILKNNSVTGKDDFNQEAEYYLALSYIRNNEPAKAIPLIQQIRATKDHLYQKMANKGAKLDLTFLKWKSTN